MKEIEKEAQDIIVLLLHVIALYSIVSKNVADMYLAQWDSSSDLVPKTCCKHCGR